MKLNNDDVALTSSATAYATATHQYYHGVLNDVCHQYARGKVTADILGLMTCMKEQGITLGNVHVVRDGESVCGSKEFSFEFSSTHCHFLAFVDVEQYCNAVRAVQLHPHSSDNTKESLTSRIFRELRQLVGAAEAYRYVY